jgi:hypothetical protein
MDQDLQHEELGSVINPRGADWLATAFVYYFEKIGSAVHYIHDQFSEYPSLESCKTPDEVRSYARSIQTTQPGFASELFAAADRASDE